MKKLKIVLWIIFVALLVLVFFQNKTFLVVKQALMLDLYVADGMQSPPLPIAVWLLIAMVIGFLIAYVSLLIEKFKTKRLLKALKVNLESQERMIAQLKQELAAAQGFHSNAMADAEAIDVTASGHENNTLLSDG